MNVQDQDRAQTLYVCFYSCCVYSNKNLCMVYSFSFGNDSDPGTKVTLHWASHSGNGFACNTR